jgi:hypothetical protein
MELIIQPGGEVACIYGEDLDLRQLGTLRIRRASHVEPASDGQWTADMSPVSGPQLGPFSSRSQALAAELQWLTEHLAAATAQLR